jgi:hypothetical protein
MFMTHRSHPARLALALGGRKRLLFRRASHRLGSGPGIDHLQHERPLAAELVLQGPTLPVDLIDRRLHVHLTSAPMWSRHAHPANLFQKSMKQLIS